MKTPSGNGNDARKRIVGRPGSWWRRLLHGPMQVSVDNAETGQPQLYVCYRPLRMGYGDRCELHLDGGPGPDVLLELEQAREPLRLSSALPPQDLNRRVELSVDGRPLLSPVQALHPGSHVAVVDKTTGRRYDLTVEPRRPWFLRPRSLVAALVLLSLAVALSGAYLYYAMRGTRSELSDAAALTDQRLQQALKRIASAELQIDQAISELQAEQQANSRNIRRQFDQRLEQISQRSRERLHRLSEQDIEARRALEQQNRAAIAALRQEMSAKMVDGYQRFKNMEQRLLAALAERAAPLEPEGKQFKRVFAEAHDAVVFIRTRDQMEFLKTGEVSEYSAAGSGFLLAADGLGVTAQHVLYPWRYDRDFLVLKKLNLVRLVPDSAHHSLWLAGAVVTRADADEPEYLLDEAYRSDGSKRALRVLYSPPINLRKTVQPSPLGLVTVDAPAFGPTDVSVFQITDPDPARQFAFLTLRDPTRLVEALDDVLAVGFPYSRLPEGIAAPQAARGFVRRAGRDIIELDAPMHPGLSGGAILDRDGQVIGLASGYIGSEQFSVAVRGADIAQMLRRVDTAGGD